MKRILYTLLYLLSFLVFCIDVPDDYSFKHLDHYIFRILPIDTVFYSDTLNNKVFSGDTIYLSDINSKIANIDTVHKIIYDTLYLTDIISDSIIDTIGDSVIGIDTIFKCDTTFIDKPLINEVDHIYPYLGYKLNHRSDLDNSIQGFISLNVGDSIYLQVSDDLNSDVNYAGFRISFIEDLSLYNDSNKLISLYWNGSVRTSFLKIKAKKASKGIIVIEDSDYEYDDEYALSYFVSPLDSVSLMLDTIEMGYYYDINKNDSTKAINWIKLVGSSNAYSITVMLGVKYSRNLGFNYYDRHTIINNGHSQSPFEFTFRLEDDLMPNELYKSIKSVRLIIRGTAGFDKELFIPIPE